MGPPWKTRTLVQIMTYIFYIYYTYYDIYFYIHFLAWGTSSEPELPLVLLQNKRYRTTLSGMMRLNWTNQNTVKTQRWYSLDQYEHHESATAVNPYLKWSSIVACLHTVSQCAVPMVNNISCQTSQFPFLFLAACQPPYHIRSRLSLTVKEMHYIFLWLFQREGQQGAPVR